MRQVRDVNISSCELLSPPARVLAELPLDETLAVRISSARAVICDILERRDPRFLVLVGPCSIHNVEDGEAYARRLQALAGELSDRMFVVMRAYFEKPRTVLGWKGMIYDPRLDNSNDIESGLRQARRLLRDIVEIGLPVATEILEPIVPQYIADLVAWGAIGARTAESQTHRQMASGLSMPIGFKNATDGSMTVAVEAIRAAAAAHAFIGIDGNGHVATFRTKGNPHGHLVLRGGRHGPNYGSEYIAFAKELMRKSQVPPNIVVDCSHANSSKDYRLQPKVLMDVIAQRRQGESAIVGAMLESYLVPGRQDIPDSLSKLVPGQSVTDACMGWEETETVLRKAHAALA